MACVPFRASLPLLLCTSILWPAHARADETVPDPGQRVYAAGALPDGTSAVVGLRNQTPVASLTMPPATPQVTGWFGDADLSGSNDLAIGVPRASSGAGEIRFWRGLPPAAWPNWLPYAAPSDAQKLRFMPSYCADAGTIVAPAPRDAAGLMRVRVSALDLQGQPMVLIVALPALELVGEVRGESALEAFERLPGDIDDDGIIGANDIALVLSALGATGSGLPGDVDMNGLVGANDLVLVIEALGNEAAWLDAVAVPSCPTPCAERIGAGSSEQLPPLAPVRRLGRWH